MCPLCIHVSSYNRKTKKTGGPRMNYEDSHKKSGFLTGVESRVTAMRGAAGWRRQLELASERVGRANLLALLLYCFTAVLLLRYRRYVTAAYVLRYCAALPRANSLLYYCCFTAALLCCFTTRELATLPLLYCTALLRTALPRTVLLYYARTRYFAAALVLCC